jgi:hypothetical protein
MTRSELVAAFEANDHDATRRLGWWDLWDHAHSAYAPKQPCRAKDMVPYAKLLGDEDPADILKAFLALAGDWRPTPAQVKGHLNLKRGDGGRVDVGRGRDRASTPEAISATADAYNAGERPCDCHVRRFVWRFDAATGTLRCRTCNGLEWGQVYAAADAGHIEAVA